MTIEQAFNNTTAYYDDWMKKALPNFNDLFNSAVDIVPFMAEEPIKVLDLGAGSGLFTWFIQQKYKQAGFVLIDLADKLLETAKTRFAGSSQSFEYILGDYRDLRSLPAFDLVISSLSIHHLTHAEKQDLFKQVYQKLKPGGAFINIDQVHGETEGLRKLYWDHWLNQVNSSGASREQIEDSIQRRTTYDKDALLADQLLWLKQAGFSDVDCVYKNFFVGVFLGKKTG